VSLFKHKMLTLSINVVNCNREQISSIALLEVEMPSTYQTADDVHSVMWKIALRDFRTALYADTTIEKNNVVWIGLVQRGSKHRFVTIHDAHTKQPKLRILSRSQSEIYGPAQIADAVILDAEGEITLASLLSGGHEGIVMMLNLESDAERPGAFKTIFGRFVRPKN
jgi:hypothetical protein